MTANITYCILIIAIIIGCILLGSTVYYTIILGISPMPSSRKARLAIVDAIKRYKPEAGRIYELGSGWGGVCRMIARNFPNAQVIGLELSVIPLLWSRLRKGLSKERIVSIRYADIMGQSLGDAEVIITYLYTGAMRKLAGKFERELLPGALIISNTFALPGWMPIETVKLKDIYHTPIYIYRKA